MSERTIVVEGVVPSARDDTNLREEAWSFCLDQRAFGPGRLLVAFAERDGRFRGLAHTRRTDPIESALEACLDYLGRGAAAAVAFNDELVEEGPPPADLAARFQRASALCAAFGVYLVDWFSCDDDKFRSSRLAVHPGEEWWEVP